MNPFRNDSGFIKSTDRKYQFLFVNTAQYGLNLYR